MPLNKPIILYICLALMAAWLIAFCIYAPKNSIITDDAVKSPDIITEATQ